MNEGIGARLEKVRGKTSIKKFGEQYGAAANTVRAYEKEDSSPPIDYLLKMCRGEKINPDWLIHGKGAQIESSRGTVENDGPWLSEDRSIHSIGSGLSVDDFYFLPMVETALSAGNGSFVINDTVETYYAFRKSFINRIATSHRNVILARATGNSMEKIIRDGDTLMLDTGSSVIEDGKIFAVRFGDTLAIKRLSLLPNSKIMVISENKEEYPPYEADAKDIHVIGKLLMSSHMYV